jgi:hypothetical protein
MFENNLTLPINQQIRRQRTITPIYEWSLREGRQSRRSEKMLAYGRAPVILKISIALEKRTKKKKHIRVWLLCIKTCEWALAWC